MADIALRKELFDECDGIAERALPRVLWAFRQEDVNHKQLKAVLAHIAYAGAEEAAARILNIQTDKKEW
jgi:hypothetical protein